MNTLPERNALNNDALTADDRIKVAAFIEKNSGIQCPSSKHNLIESRLRKRQRLLGIPSLHSYIKFALESIDGVSERAHLLDALTTNKTDFYREVEHFHCLKEWLERQFLREKTWDASNPLRCWSAGCSTGEEPYTLAIELLEIQNKCTQFEFKILATDISARCINTAQRAVYPHNRIEPIALQLRKRYLLRSRDAEKNLVKMAPEVRAKVNFKIFNLLHDSFRPLGKFDVIFCRNVMIYFDAKDRKSILEKFAQRLKPNGLLFVGHSENLVGFDDIFEKLQPTVYKLRLPGEG